MTLSDIISTKIVKVRGNPGKSGQHFDEHSYLIDLWLKIDAKRKNLI